MKEVWTIIGVGLVLAGLILNQGWALRADIAELRAGQADLQQRVASIEGLLQGMLPSMAFVESAALEQASAEQP